MNIGMLWYDNDPKTSLAEKVQKAWRRKSIPWWSQIHQGKEEQKS